MDAVVGSLPPAPFKEFVKTLLDDMMDEIQKNNPSSKASKKAPN